ncbi:PREDICTED: RNA-binding protein BRN1-like isoform X2 [Ipomoea nil]|uniref:RNA-binding protein BRN1-like isoform X2 n=1 Tax=Ipomoea nil TaxID=35883 RepID=UPI00090144DE|nr:PREDICTED: RNA-binding protein BRN1-like isoform X2 [Ipomoea nil]
MKLRHPDILFSLIQAASPLQVKYADEHKIFVGMLPKNVSDAEVSGLFSQYGTVKDLQILRGSQQTSKGCAFSKYETREQAVAAIEAINGKHKMEVVCCLPIPLTYNVMS